MSYAIANAVEKAVNKPTTTSFHGPHLLEGGADDKQVCHTIMSCGDEHSEKK
jgi:hypothetical protein